MSDPDTTNQQGGEEWVTPWNPPPAEQLPDLRGELANHVRSRAELEQTAAVLAQGLGSISPTPTTRPAPLR